MSKRTLDEIEADFAALDQLLDELEGDVTGQEEALDAMMAELEDQRDEKLEGYRYYLKRLDAGVEWKKAEEQRLASRRRTEEQRVEWLKARLLTFVQASGGRIETAGGTFAAQRNAPSMELLVPAEELPEEYRGVSVSYYAETAKIRDELKVGTPLPFAQFRKPTYHLRIR